MKAARLFVLMTLNYGLIALSFRLLALGSYAGVASTDFLIAWWGFTMTRYVVQASTTTERMAYAAGGAVGSMIGLWLTT